MLNGVMGIADKIRNKEYGALARGGGYAAGSVAQVYLLRKGVQKCGDWIDTKTYKPESFSKYMSPEDAKAYLEFLEHGSTAGLTDAELLGIQKVDDALALKKLNYGSSIILQNPQIKGTNSGLNYNLQFFADKGGGNKSVNDIISNLPETTNGKGVARNFEATNGFEQTIKDFDSLGPIDVKEIQTKYGLGKVGKLSDGTTVVARPGSKTGGPTLEIKVSNSKVYKIRY